MPDKNKLEIFKKTNMILFKGCVLCKHGEIPANTTWGYCKHPDHFYDHAKHGRLPGSSHASMGCHDFKMKHVTHRDMIELGPYLELVPIHDAIVEEVGVEVEEVDAETKFKSMLFDLLKNGDKVDDVWQFGGESEDQPVVEIHFKGSPKAEEKKTDNGEPVEETVVEKNPAQSSAQSSAQSTKKASKRGSKKKVSSQPEPVDEKTSSEDLAYQMVTTVPDKAESTL